MYQASGSTYLSDFHDFYTYNIKDETIMVSDKEKGAWALSNTHNLHNSLNTKSE